MSSTATNSLLQATEIEGRGRALVAAQPLKAGQIVLRDSPILVYSALPFTHHSSSTTVNYAYCANCFLTLRSQSSSSQPSPVPCPSCCSDHVFCGPSCLSIALASSHSTWACEALRRLRSCTSLVLEQTLERQVQARFLVAAYNLAIVSPSNFQLLLSLQGQPTLSSPESFAAARFLHSLIASLCPPPIALEGFSLDLSAALLAKDKLNAFGLMEPFSEEDGGKRSVRAYGIYPMASFFNHDCLPNACRFDYLDAATNGQILNTDIIVRMIHDVPQGREICLSYFPVNLDYSGRQRMLVEDYGFTCLCDRCRVEASWSEDGNDDEFDGEEEEVMDEDEDHGDVLVTTASDFDVGDEEETDFPHAYFFVSYMCDRTNCGGTLAPLPPKDDGSPSNILECNVCGKLRNDEGIDGGGGEDQTSMDE